MLRKRVLVIEDDKDSLHVISELLRRAEHEVLTAESGHEALRLLDAEVLPDLVLLNVWLPDMTAEALLSRLNGWPGVVSVPVLLLTADGDGLEDRNDLASLGVVGVLRKPFEPDELIQTLHALRPSQPAAAPPLPPQNDRSSMRPQTRQLSDLLTRVSEVLAQCLDIGAQLRDVARAIVPAYASACVIERVDTGASVRELLCTQHESPALDADLRGWARRPEWLAQVLAEVADSGKPRLLDLETDATLLASDGAGARVLGFESVVVVPMIARRRVFGLLTCAARATRPYGQSHVETFTELSHRVALALDNAELCASAQQTRSDHDALSHALASELQAPLVALADLARDAVERSGSARERGLAETFLREASRLQSQLQALKDFADCAAGQLRLAIRELEIEGLLRAHLNSHAQSKLLTLQLDSGLSGLRVLADAERLEQALDALLQVATSDHGNVEVALGRPAEDDAELLLTVSCTGPCLSAQQLASLGQLTAYAYDRDAAKVMSDPQPAFGLRLARALIEAQGGRFWAETQRNWGNIFYIALPLRHVQRCDTTEKPSPNAVILLIDSDLAFRRELQEILSERGYQVETADNGLQAWQYLLAHSPPALILFDLVLPAMDGWELHAAIRSHAALQLVPTVVVSGLDRYRIEASLPDANGYIEKPIRSAQLFEVVQKHVVSPARTRTLSVRPSFS